VSADARAALDAALAGRYVVQRELGRGGMATVYLARDLRHERPVALKVLHPELAMALGAERFQREIRLAARLQHPQIHPVHASGEIPGPPGNPPILWFSMPFIEGESLRDRLNREKQLSLDEALRVTREAADALDYAHRHGVIHRDIKPENILLSDGHALVADFGIGKALTQASDEQLTETGLAVGTPAYMSPEQAAGGKDLDPRSDIYSLATVLYEMLAGETPFAAPTAQAMIARRFMESPKPLRERRESVPEAVEQAVQKALARTTADRFATAAEFARALAVPTATATATATTGAGGTPAPTGAVVAPPRIARRRIPIAPASLALGFVLGLGLLFGWLRRHGGEVPGAEGVKLLAVLPFENLGSAEDEYFADGVTDAVRGKLTSLPGLQVTASNSSSQYKRATKSPQQIARELGVDYLLVGKVRWEKRPDGTSRVQVSPELIQAATAAAKWQQPFDATITDVFQVQADIAGRVAQALDVALGAHERQTLAQKPTGDLAAYDAYLRGEKISGAMSASDPVTLRRAVAYYEQAVALDTGFALAWAQLSRAHSNIYGNGVPAPEEAAKARQAADRALALAPSRPEGRLALAEYYRQVERDNERTLEQATLGQRATTRNADLIVMASLAEQNVGRWTQALEHLRQARRLDPRSAQTARRLGTCLFFLRRYPEALEAYDYALSLAPTNITVLEFKAMVPLAQGDLDGARAVLRSAPEIEPASLVAYVATFYDLFWALDEEQGELLLRLGPGPFDDDRGVWGLALAGAYGLRGDRARSRAYADSARLAIEAHLRETPQEPTLLAGLGTALAYLGRKSEAIREGERAVALTPIATNGFGGPYFQHQLARSYILLGEPEKALDQLEPLLKVPYYLSPGWLKIDPTFDPLRRHPRFQKLVEGTT
jgi:TolB-like protein/Flp pilus assembly protein TadD